MSEGFAGSTTKKLKIVSNTLTKWGNIEIHEVDKGFIPIVIKKNPFKRVTGQPFGTLKEALAIAHTLAKQNPHDIQISQNTQYFNTSLIICQWPLT